MEHLGTKYIDVFIPCSGEMQEIIATELVDIGFEGTWEDTDGVHGYIDKEELDQAALNELLDDYSIDAETVKTSALQNINWNEDWEKSYDPIRVDDKVFIRAEFHDVPEGIDYDIIIQPKMSFGTGHHDTTRLAVQLMLNMSFENKKVIDVGCGTGVLAILAGMKGSTDIIAIDNNPWSYENTLENAERNAIDMQVEHRDIEEYTGESFDIILSNITRNINHAHIPKYRDMLAPLGELVMSGFFEHDFDFINEQAIKHGFRLLNKVVSEKNWIALHYQKD